MIAGNIVAVFRCARPGKSCTIVCMIWVRKGVVHLLSLLLFSALLGGVVAASVDIAFSHPDKVEAWLSQSNFYNSFVNNAVKQANDSANNNGQSNGVSLNDVAVQQAAESAFSPALVQKDVNTILDSNYAWLQGKTKTPDFSVDLSSAKESFAQKVGQYVQAHLASLPVCTTAQALTQPTTDPLAMTCRPAVLDPVVAGAQATKQLEASSDFLNNPVITANTINQNGNASSPYYKQLSAAPRVYRAATSLPWVLAAVAVLCAVGIFFIAPRKRLGLRRIGYVLLVAGVLLTAVKFVADAVFKRVEDKLFNQAVNGPLQQSLTTVAHKAESQLVNVNMYFGIAFVVLALVIFVVLIVTRGRAIKPPKLGPAVAAASEKPKAMPAPKSSAPPAAPSAAGEQPRPTVTRSKRPPRLIQ